MLRALTLTVATTTLLTACYERKTKVVETGFTCRSETLVSQETYDRMLKSRDAIKREPNLGKLSEYELTRYWVDTHEFIKLFEKDLKACAFKPDGTMTQYTWDRASLARERAQLDRLTQALEPRLAGGKPGTPPSADAPVPPSVNTRYPGAASTSSLSAFMQAAVRSMRARGLVHLEFERLTLRGEIPGLAQDEIQAAALRYFETNFDQIEPVVVAALTANVTNYSSPKAKLAFADEIPALAPVVAYFKAKGESLSDVVVVSASLRDIPHTGGGTYADALGIFIPPMALPIKVQLTLPGRELRAGATGTLDGMLNVRVEGADPLILAAMKQHFRSSKLIYLDLARINKNVSGAAGFEAVAAHEMRHLLDYFACPQSGEAWCDQKKVDADMAAVREAARANEKSDFEAYLADPDTRRTEVALLRLHLKYRPGETEEGAQWASASVKQLFDNNYQATYPHFFSMQERRGYGEQLAYLKSGGASAAQAVRTAMVTSTGESMSVQMAGKTESVPWPGRPWIAKLFYGLLSGGM